MDYFKTVLMPIEVSIGDYCWGDHRLCPHFDNEGGYATCNLGFDIGKQDKKGRYPKPFKCKNYIS